jgi:uncharacterized protein
MSSNERKEATKNISAYLKKQNIRFESMDSVNSICYAAKLNCFAVRANGGINKCTVALEEDANNVGLLRNDGSMLIRREKLLNWARGLESGNEQELLCPLRNMPESF